MLQTQAATDLPMAIPSPSVYRTYRTRVKSKESPDIIISGDDQRDLSQSFDFANLRSERRNSFSAFFGLASRQRWNDRGNETGRNISVPNILSVRPNSTQTGSYGKHRGLKLYQYLNMKGASPDRDTSLTAIAPAYSSPQGVETSSRLEDEFEKIRLQLAEMSQESGRFKQRIQTLSRAVNDLHNTISQQEHLEEDEERETEDEEEEDQLSDSYVCENSLPSPLCLFPPNGWGSVSSSVGDSNESIPHESTQSDTATWLEASSCRQETDGFNGPLCVIRVEDADSETTSESEHDDFFSSVLRQFAQSS